MKIEIKEEIGLPEGVEARMDESLIVKGPKGEVSKRMRDPKIGIKVEGKKIRVEAVKATKREKARAYAFLSHIKNMIAGVTKGHFYELKICSGHFPMAVSVEGKDLVIKNFLGENVPRRLRIKEGVEVKVEGNLIKVESSDKEKAGQCAANIEKLTWIKGRDRRIFQDGCFIINKDGKEIK